MRKHIVLVDGNGWGFAGMSGPHLSAGEKDTQGIFSVVKKARHLMLDYPNCYPMILWDGRSWRKDIYPEYKANREVTAKQVEARAAYYDQKADIVRGLGLLGLTQVRAANMEADDLAEIISRNAISQGNTVTLVSADKDWQQLVQPGVVWFDGIRDLRCSHLNFTEVTGCTTIRQFIETKCILGDAGDNVKGIKGIGPKTLETIYCYYESFLTFMRDDPEQTAAFWLKVTGKKLPKVLRELNRNEAMETLRFNNKLVNLSTKHRPAPIDLKRDKQSLNMEGFVSFCGENAFLTILRDIDNFLLPFKENVNVVTI